VQAKVLGQEADLPSTPHVLQRVSRNHGLPGGRVDEADQHFNQGALAGAIGAKEPENLSLLHGEADVSAGCLLTVDLGKMRNFNNRHYLTSGAMLSAASRDKPLMALQLPPSRQARTTVRSTSFMK